MTSDFTTLADGVILRSAVPKDFDAICELLTDRGESADAVDFGLIVNHPGVGWAGVGVVEVGGEVVATATLLNETIRVGTATLAIGQIELVACAELHEHRGYVRALMKWCHALSYTEGHVAQVMIGIPYFYRRFGYHYAIPMHPYATLRNDATPAGNPDITVRPATDTDIAGIAALHENMQERFDIAMPHQPECWQWLIDRDGSTTYVAQRRGTVVASARWTPPEDQTILVSEVAAIDTEALRALFGPLRDSADCEIKVHSRPHVDGLADLLGPNDRADWYYVRIEDPTALFAALRPELERRLSESEYSEADQLVELSFWESQLSFPIANSRIGPIETGGPRQVIVSQGGSGLPPDALAHLVFGCGAAGLEARFADCYLGDQRSLMEALFPAQQADVLTFYLPN